jgi:hypothetical protein
MLVYFVAIWSILRPDGIFCGHLVYFVAIWYILRPYGIFCGHLVYFMVIWHIFPRFGMLYQEKSGNPGLEPRHDLFVKTREKHVAVINDG